MSKSTFEGFTSKDALENWVFCILPVGYFLKPNYVETKLQNSTNNFIMQWCFSCQNKSVSLPKISSIIQKIEIGPKSDMWYTPFLHKSLQLFNIHCFLGKNKHFARNKNLILFCCYVSLFFCSRGLFLESPQNFSGPYLTIAKLQTSSRCIHFSVFTCTCRCIWTKNVFTGPESFWSFQEMSPRTIKNVNWYPTCTSLREHS